MTLPRNALATAMIAVGCMTGLTACGGGGGTIKVSDAKFITKCEQTLSKDKNASAAVKAHDPQACKCLQDTLKAQGLGDKDQNSKEVGDKSGPALQACGLKKQ
jgi:hypothetical protein